MVAYPRLPLSGLLDFKAPATGTFDAPRNDVQNRRSATLRRRRRVGQVTARLGMRSETLTIQLEASSPRLAITGTGNIGMTPQMDAELTIRFTDASIDP